ncbi:MAG: TIM-barrel domain-containing protein, partial [Tepidisphaeraceae bacterium]
MGKTAKTLMIAVSVTLVAVAAMAADRLGEREFNLPLEATVSEVAPGVYRLRAGEPEKIVPSLVRMPAKTDGLEAMPKAAAPPLSVPAIKIVRMARGCRIELPLASGEIIYGLGLQCKHLEQNGWRRTLFTASGDDNGKGMGHAPVPFYVSTAGYGVLVDSARYMTFSVGEKQRLADASSLAGAGKEKKIITDVAELYGPERRDATSVYVDVPAARGVDVFLFAGPSMGEAVARYNLFSGGGCMPALSGIGPSYIFGAMLDCKSVLAMCDRLKKDRLPVTSAGLEPGWQTHAYSSSYVWNPRRFPADFGATMRQQGYDLNLWCQLYIDPSSPLLPLLGRGFGDFEVWNGVIPDLAAPKVRETYRDFLAENFVRKGVAGFKLDEVDGSPNTHPAYQEWMFPEFTSFPSGADGDQMRNLLGRLGMQAIADAFRKENRRTFSLVRAAQAWSSPLPVAIYSDEYDFADYMRYNLSAGVQGLLWAPEVRHADNERDWALRVGAATFSARMIYNGWQFPNFPWQQPNLAANERNQLLPDDNPYIRITRRFNYLRMALLPYLYQAYGDYHRKGIPPVRPLVSDWPEDPYTRHIGDQWMLGSDLLVAPLTEANSFVAYNGLVVD